jgi:NAD(P)-dependent dehydrogenase (short-subunit alcohol dehydrogenase family)
MPTEQLYRRRQCLTVELVALVTGAMGGIGRAVVGRLVADGWTVVATDLHPKPPLDLRAARYWPSNVTNESTVRRVLDHVDSEFGRLDAVVNCAGVIDVAEVADMSTPQWERVIDVNLTGTFIVSRECLRLVRRSPRGRVICIASDAGKTAEPGLAHYSASKFGVIGFVQSLALELASELVTVNAVCPVICETDMMESLAAAFAESSEGVDADAWRDRFVAEIPMGRACRPDEVAAVVGFLAGGSAGFITGQAINVSGGHEVH